MRIPRISILTICLCWLMFAAPVVSSDADKTAIFGAKSRVEIEITDRSGVAFIDLGKALSAETEVDSGAIRNGARLKAAGTEAEFRNGDKQVRFRGKIIALDAPAMVQADRVQIPVANLATMLRQFVKKNIISRTGRVFIGDAADFVTTELRPGDNTSLVLRFREPVNPSISSEGNKVVLRFEREPAILTTTLEEFDDKTIRKLQFTEGAASAELSVTGSAPLIAKFEEGNRMIVISAAPAAAVASVPTPSEPVAQPPAVEGQVPTVPTPELPAANGVSQSTGGTRTAVVAIDPAHGGIDAGVRFSEKLLEKDLALSIAEKIRGELSNRGISSIVLRTQDQELANDERAEMANAAKVSFYIGVHAGQGESGVRIYRPLAARKSGALFTPWDHVQGTYLDKSDSLAAALATQMSEKKIAVRALSGNTAPLSHVAAAAVAVEVAPSSRNDDRSLESSAYQLKVAQAVAAAIAEERGKK